MVARLPPPPTVVTMDYVDEQTPPAGRRCSVCGGIFKGLDNATPPPGSYAEAWKPPVLCRGTFDPDEWSWCKVSGELLMPYRMLVKYFPDRRVKTRG